MDTLTSVKCRLIHIHMRLFHNQSNLHWGSLKVTSQHCAVTHCAVVCVYVCVCPCRSRSTPAPSWCAPPAGGAVGRDPSSSRPALCAAAQVRPRRGRRWRCRCLLVCFHPAVSLKTVKKLCMFVLCFKTFTTKTWKKSVDWHVVCLLNKKQDKDESQASSHL